MKLVSTVTAVFASVLFSPSVFSSLTPEPTLGCGGLQWDPTSATNINVHKGNGDYVQSISGTNTVWAAPESGEYFLVGTDNNDWSSWTRSDSVMVDISSSNGCVDPSLLIENDKLTVLSSTEIEITWELTGLGRYAYMQIIRTNDMDTASLVSNESGTSHYADSLIPNVEYTFALIPYDQYGAAGDVIIRQVTTSGGGAVVPTAPLTPLGLRVDVYSNSALEIFWQHNNDYVFGESVYSVELDGSTIRTLDGTSLFIDNLSAGTTYELSVSVARNSSASSEAAIIDATTLGAASSGMAVPSVVSVDTNGTISWTDDGWYQIQDILTLQTVCEGFGSCTVPPGRYIVINHHTGVRETVSFSL